MLPFMGIYLRKIWAAYNKKAIEQEIANYQLFAEDHHNVWKHV